MSNLKSMFTFKVELARRISTEEFDALCSAVLAQVEELQLADDEVKLGYIIGSEEFEAYPE